MCNVGGRGVGRDRGEIMMYFVCWEDDLDRIWVSMSVICVGGWELEVR